MQRNKATCSSSENRIFRLAVFILLLWTNVSPLAGQQLTLTKAPNALMRETGQNIVYTISGGCSDLVNDCTGAVLSDVLDDDLEIISAGTIIIDGTPIFAVINTGTNTVTWDFTGLPEGGLPAGASFTVELTAQIKAGVTPDGTVINNTAELESDADLETASTDVTAEAEPQWDVSKSVTTGPIYHDQDVTYQVLVENTGGTVGNLNLENVVIVDQLPDGAIYVSSSPAGVYDMGTNTVAWTVPLIEVTTNSLAFDVTVQYPFPDGVPETPEEDAAEAFNMTGPPGPTMPIPKTNEATLTADPVGEPSLMLMGEVTQDLLPPVVEAGIVKDARDNNILVIGETNYFRVGVSNAGTSALENYVVTDDIPDQFDLVYVELENFTPGTMVTITVEINGGPMTVTLPVATPPALIDIVAAVPITAGDYVSSIEFDFGDVPVDFSGDINLSVTPAYDDSGGLPALDNAGNPVVLETPYTNTATVTATNPFDMSPVVTPPGSDFMCITESTARFTPDKSVAPNYVVPPPGVPTTGNPYFPGTRVRYTIRLENDGADGTEPLILTGATSFENIIDPILSDLLPSELTYEPFSWMIINNNAPGLTIPPVFTETPNYNGTGDNLLRWDFTGTLEPGDFLDITFNATIDNDPGLIGTTIVNPYCVGSETTDVICGGAECGEETDNMGTTSFDLIDFFGAAGDPVTMVTEACCDAVEIMVVDETAVLKPNKELLSTGPYYPEGSPPALLGLGEDEVEYLVTWENDDMANVPAIDPMGFDLLPEEFDYAPGSLTLISNTTGLVLDDLGGNPAFVVTPDYMGTGRTLLRWDFTGDFPIGSEVSFSFRVAIQPGAIGSIENDVQMTSDNNVVDCDATITAAPDVNDLDGDGDTAELFCTLIPPPIVLVSNVTSLIADKFVQGANDVPDFLQLPDIASTNDGDAVTGG